MMTASAVLPTHFAIIIIVMFRDHVLELFNVADPHYARLLGQRLYLIIQTKHLPIILPMAFVLDFGSVFSMALHSLVHTQVFRVRGEGKECLVQCNLYYPDTFVQGSSAVIPVK